MGSAGQPMLVIKANRTLLKKRKFKDIKDLVIETSGKTELQFKQVSPEELALIKAKIRKEAKKAAEKEITIYGVCILIVFILVIYAFI
jgi:hypothetical protein